MKGGRLSDGRVRKEKAEVAQPTRRSGLVASLDLLMSLMKEFVEVLISQCFIQFYEFCS